MGKVAPDKQVKATDDRCHGQQDGPDHLGGDGTRWNLSGAGHGI